MSEIAYPPNIEEVVNTAKIVWPGWRIYLGRDNEGGGWPVLHIISRTFDSYAAQYEVNVNHSFLVPMADYNIPTWEVWIFERLCDVFRHEAGEILEFNEVKKFAPHHGNGENPYVTWYVGDYADTKVRAGDTKPSI